MFLVCFSKKKVKQLKFYNEKECWDYPIEELSYLLNDKENINKVYVIDENRIYETKCNIKDFNKIIEKM